MGFFRFIRKDKNKLGLPPAPPIGELPSLESEFPSLPEMPPIPSMGSEEMELPEPPKRGMWMPSLEAAQPRAEEPDQYSGELPAPKLLETPVPTLTKARADVNAASSPIYMEIDIYRDILDEINSIKDSIRAADNALQRLSEIKDSREKELGRWHARIEDIQKKLSFIDRSLFEGK